MTTPLSAAALALIPLLGGASQVPESLWAGTVHADGTQVGIRVRLDLDGGTARVTVPHFGWYEVEASAKSDGRSVQVDWNVYRDGASLQLEPEEDYLVGTWDGWGTEGSVILERTLDPRLTWREEAVDFESHGSTIQGTLMLPAGEGPFPAIVWTHGSGRVDREDPLYRSHAAWVVEHGIASLIYDKRPPRPTPPCRCSESTRPPASMPSGSIR